MKLLFVTCNSIEDNTYGGAKCSRRNYELLRARYDSDIYLSNKISFWHSFAGIFEGFFPPFCKKHFDALKKIIENSHYDAVFLDGSYFGNLAEYLCKKQIKTILFFHNCEYDYIDVRFGEKKSLKKLIYKYLIKKSENRSVLAGDYLIALSKRDSDRLNKLYGRSVNIIIPMSIDDIYIKREPNKQEHFCLLLGPMGAANNKGFGWFIKNVSPKLLCKTVVVGKGYELMKKQWSSENVEVRGFVEDITQVYADADCVAIPLFSGGGMKIKTTEALMFGKYIVGTDEAYEGFDSNTVSYGKLCNTADEFISAINDYIKSDKEKFNPLIRQKYLDMYSMEAGKKAFEAVYKYIEQ